VYDLHPMSQTTLLQYEAPCKYSFFVIHCRTDIIAGPVCCLDWCKSPAPGQHRPRSAFRLGIASFQENYQNRIAVIGLQDERVLIEDDYTDYPNFVTFCEAHHGYPATSLQWQPASADTFPWAQRALDSEYLATTGDALRVWEYSTDVQPPMQNYVGRQGNPTAHKLTLKTALSGVCQDR
jgi:DDB1- and CUL4-associated factor 7